MAKAILKKMFIGYADFYLGLVQEFKKEKKKEKNRSPEPGNRKV